jgi:hypothetical protein
MCQAQSEIRSKPRTIREAKTNRATNFDGWIVRFMYWGSARSPLSAQYKDACLRMHACMCGCVCMCMHVCWGCTCEKKPMIVLVSYLRCCVCVCTMTMTIITMIISSTVIMLPCSGGGGAQEGGGLWMVENLCHGARFSASRLIKEQK